MKIKIESRLHDMIGRTYMHKNTNVKVMRYKLDDITVTVITDLRDIVFPVENAEDHLADFLPVAEVMTGSHAVPDTLEDQRRQIPVLPNLIINKQSASLSEIIMQNIQDLQKDPSKENLARAAAVNDQVKSMLDICKIEVEALKVTAYVDKYTRG